MMRTDVQVKRSENVEPIESRITAEKKKIQTLAARAASTIPSDPQELHIDGIRLAAYAMIQNGDADSALKRAEEEIAAQAASEHLTAVHVKTTRDVTVGAGPGIALHGIFVPSAEVMEMRNKLEKIDATNSVSFVLTVENGSRWQEIQELSLALVKIGVSAERILAVQRGTRLDTAEASTYTIRCTAL